MLTRRLQVLIDDARFERLERRSSETGASVGALVRQAIDELFPPGSSDPGRAGAEFLAAEPMPVEDWPAMKADMLAAMYGRGPSPT